MIVVMKFNCYTLKRRKWSDWRRSIRDDEVNRHKDISMTINGAVRQQQQQQQQQLKPRCGQDASGWTANGAEFPRRAIEPAGMLDGWR